MGTYLITGANRGIGLEYCRQLKKRGDDIIGVCREVSPELKALEISIETNIDLTSNTDVERLMKKLNGQKLDVLINNAGILDRVSLNDLDVDSIRQQFEVNALATLRFTHALLPNLKAGAKIIFMTSRMGSIEDNTSGGSYGYRMSKVALSMAGKSLSVDLKPKNIAVAILHPGLVKTRMTNFNPNGITPEQSVKGLIARIDQLNLKNTGTFWHSNGEVLPW
ncbi:SDR family oxidoreductase [Crocosphaera chwakensis]|uniref:Short-chain dehydrogenase/reductase family enzyme n=1 Tax=Crocosphaera chwakensis CCY0110 TaxID=391612 RepID=A3ISH8_9CHRO|nr:SDR family oxidoreductase [Crocosphaera chwakensis]EAZ90548.1 Short-chain dehydrogenase/reductase family enzyme [Crocosphaera chwakensis CCY0110]